ncbi:hypothetical protein SmJEL517_g00810 [Synchytrium microbalum]|uniref:SH3 domain-containing protein n=1 Tax=Synchytrium microbalum TaxID=1806994 RepID=A0A507CGT3_9FUNG|nr:uncharacterized protein SmJEL517_g00810 [Synchytrium microbalum]TPX37194.1 hypothetical protein SmJEL517_g00810 [Synchytrium microbalum]
MALVEISDFKDSRSPNYHSPPPSWQFVNFDRPESQHFTALQESDEKKTAINILVDLTGECKKAATILDEFIKGNNKVEKNIIPPHVLMNAKGLAVISVLKAGFIWSGRAGTGLVVARLPDGRWSAPSAIAVAGAGFGGQVGAELTEFVFILNTVDAVKAFSHGTNVTLGGNLSVALGPVGRNAEASGSALNLAPVFAYSKTRGLFAGISIEGSVIVSRPEANAKFYGERITAKQILNGSVEPPAAAEPLYRALNFRFGGNNNSTAYNSSGMSYATDSQYDAPAPSGFLSQLNAGGMAGGSVASAPPRTSGGFDRSSAMTVATRGGGSNLVVALFDFAGERATDLRFARGDVIVVTKRTDSKDDWWEGRANGKEGVFPANYVRPAE